MTKNAKETSDRIAHLAAVILARHSSTLLAKELAGSALAQHHSAKQTSAKIASLAARVLADHHSCAESKELAGSVLAQARQHLAA
ncbi:hypothetical protein [Paraburkholderia sp.]|uniref:hypothetical protein n=1 Tax=Paraburkholderia sp. TaxID=1926495 RepID=UPI0023A280CB|nr:hypothetical protein [Paraburkholderia sp.]MDE1182835.1 hypothetical protein [Paraburkholderia sp.]